MDPSKADRKNYHQVLQLMAAQPSQAQRVFPDYIYINWEAYMRTADPFWEARRPATSCMYQSRVDTHGQIDTTHRMQQWLHELPVPDSQPSPKRLRDTKPRSQSAPVHGVGNHSPVRRFHHPNPLSQHPVEFELEKLPPPFKIPQRKSSLQHSLRNSQLDPPLTPPNQQGDLVQGIQQIQLGEPVEFRGASQIESSLANEDTTTTETYKNVEMADHQGPITVFRSASASKRHTVQFGEMLEDLQRYLPMEDDRKRDRSESAVMADDQPSNKRRRGLFGTIRDRLSIVGTPVFDASRDGRKSSASAMIRDFGQASKGFLGKLTPGVHTHLPPIDTLRGHTHALAPRLTIRKENYHIRAAFIGDGRCGKTTLLHRFISGAFLGDHMALNSATTAYSMQMTAPMLIDNYQADLELWDISPRLNPNQTNPLAMSFFDIVVVCFDINDEANLKPVVHKWQYEANSFCPKTPVILLGLKSDLRRPYQTLRLRFLDEDEPTTATIGQGEMTAQLIKAAAYFECSAKTGEGTADMFDSMVRISVNGIKARKTLSKKNRKMSRVFRKR